MKKNPEDNDDNSKKPGSQKFPKINMLDFDTDDDGVFDDKNKPRPC